MSGRPPGPLQAAQRPLDILNLALVDVNGAIKPYLNVFLYVHRDWADATVGLIGTISGLFGIAMQTPLGAAVDAIHDKRTPLLAALVVLSVGAVLFGVSPHFWPVLVGSCLLAAIAGLLSPLVAALTLVVTPRRRLTGRMGRNSAFERAGNVAIAIGIGAIGWLLPDRAVFLLVPALCIVAAAALYSVPQPPRPRDHPKTTPAAAAKGPSPLAVLTDRRGCSSSHSAPACSTSATGRCSPWSRRTSRAARLRYSDSPNA